MNAVAPRGPRDELSAAHPLEAVLHRFDVLSLDVFDTAILRRVARPIDVFELVEPGFAAVRVEAERVARARSRCDEVTLDDIYDALPAAPARREELRARELEVERAVCVAHPAVRRLYAAARRRGMRVVFVSDMYLPREVIEGLLDAAGYGGHDGLFLSSELGITKAHGDTWALVARTLGVEPQRILHVGDDRGSDVLEARRAGLVAVHAPRPPRVQHDELAGSVHAALVRERRAAGGDDFWARIGYEQAGLLYLGFARWVRERAMQAGCERVYFLARDGWILQQVYQRLGGGPPSSYLYASRRALNLPAIERLGPSELEFLGSGYTPLTVRDFLRRISLDANEFAAEIRAAGLEGADERLQALDRERLNALFGRIAPRILAQARAERELLLEYLKQEGLTDLRKAAIVDLGWHGTLQRSLAALLGPSVQLTGLYLGTFEKARAPGHTIEGWLCNFAEPRRRYQAIRACCEIWELLHVAPHGSVLGFARGPRGVEPLFARDEMPAAQRAAAARLQSAGLDLVDDMLSLLGDRDLPIGPDTAAAGLVRIVTAPTREEAERFGDFIHGEGFGEVITPRALVPRPSWKARIGFAKILRHEYHSAYWKEGYFARNPTARVLLSALERNPKE
jgi:predicted HAD superfamily hydrolase